jgi:PKD repeat protein
MTFNKVLSTALLFGVVGFWACKKDSPVLSGTTSSSSFTFEVKRSPGGDTLPFANKVAFSNSSTEAFSYLWDFGDANTSVLPNPVHTFESGTSFVVHLTSVGKAGNSTSSKTVELESSCDYVPFSNLTGCGNKKWAVSPVSDAIRILSADGSTVETSVAPASCQSDDVYTFSVTGSLNYDSKGKTFVAEGANPNTCQAPVQNASNFFMIKAGTGNPRIVLDEKGMDRKPFLGTTHTVQGNSYEVLSLTEEAFVVEGILADGKRLQVKFVNAGLSLNSVKLFLTGGGRKTWRLDSTAGANTIVVGLEANPTQYFAGGALADCQKDDWYTFTSTDSIILNCNGSTMLPAQGFTCGADQSFSSKFTFGNVVGGVAGAAQVNLTPNTSTQWIGVFDRAPENVYRILEITSDKMLLRSGNGLGTIHTIKFVPK